jgi:hypothetical protein
MNGETHEDDVGKPVEVEDRGMMTIAFVVTVAIAVLSVMACTEMVEPPERGGTMYVTWENGPPKDPNYLPIAVWLQDPKMAPRYREAGINLYIGLWKGPTEEQLAELKAAGMPVICEQNDVGLQHKEDDSIVGWMHGDEPDNAQSLGEGQGYGPPILPERTRADYERMKANDPSRPVLLNLGQGVAWDGYIGRGVRTNHPEDYLEYIKGCDIASFDIYPVTSPYPNIRGNLWYVPRGVERLRELANGRQIVWNCIECTHIDSDRKPTPHQVKAEVWMSLIHGSMGLIYFVHEWKPRFNEHALLDDPEMVEAVTALNRQIHDLAPVLNSSTVDGGVEVRSSNTDVPMAVMIRLYGEATYLFAAGMREGQTMATFTVKDLPQSTTAEVLGEGRKIEVQNGRFEDGFQTYDVHLYRIQ